MRKFLFAVCLILIAMLALAARVWNLRDVFVEGRIYCADGDSYSRMTRARMVDEGKAWTIKHHDFENWPQGTHPHTTAPMDWLIAAGRPAASAGIAAFDSSGTSILRTQALDVAGAIVGPLLGALAVLLLGIALPATNEGSGKMRSGRWGILSGCLLLAVSPIAVHGTLLGRPDHQALLIPLLTFVLAVELRLAQQPSRGWAIGAGLGWGLALWVSLYEPLILLVLVIVGLAVWRRPSLAARERRVECIALVVVFAVGCLIDGWRVHWPDPALRDAFSRWKLSIGEMQPVDFSKGVFWRWLGFAILLAPLGLAWSARRDPESRFVFWLLLATFALTCWQLRWGYFLALTFAVGLPTIMRSVSRPWIAWVLFIVSLWPMAADWEERLFPNEAEERRRFVARKEQVSLREIAEKQGARQAGAFLAPWWLSPQIAYWSRQPGIAGSSHESLPGIVDAARIYLAPDEATALPILRARGVKWVLSDAPDRIISTSAQLLGVTPPEHCLAHEWAQHVPRSGATPSVIPETEVPLPFGNQFFQVWRVQEPNSANP